MKKLPNNQLTFLSALVMKKKRIKLKKKTAKKHATATKARTKEATLPTTSLYIDLQKSTFAKLQACYTLWVYTLPPFVKGEKSQYARLHNWAKNNTDYSYYLNMPTKTLYLLVDKKDTSPKLVYDGQELEKKAFTTFNDAQSVHCWLKALLAAYFKKEKNFVTNSNFYLYVTPNKKESYADVLKVKLEQDYFTIHEKESLAFFVISEATRMKSVTFEEYSQLSSGKVPYSYTYENKQKTFRQLKTSQLKNHLGTIWIKNTSKNCPTQIALHNIQSEEKYQKTRLALLHKFITSFIRYLEDLNIAARQKCPTFQQIKPPKTENSLSIQRFPVSIVDGRFNQQISLQKFLQFPSNFLPTYKTQEKVTPADNVLFIMDYSMDDFKEGAVFTGKEDPYKKFKQTSPSTATQGFNVNTNSAKEKDRFKKPNWTENTYLNYKPLKGKDLTRNGDICLTQLYLKRQLLTPQNAYKTLPYTKTLQDKIFLAHGYCLYFKDKLLTIEKLEELGIDKTIECITHQTGLKNIKGIFKQIHATNNRFNLEKELDITKHHLIFSSESVIQVKGMQEKFFYDQKEISTRLKEREEERPLKFFFIQPNQDDTPTRKAQIQRYNQLIDNLPERSISYKILKTKYSKGEDGYLKIFGFDNEKKFLPLLNRGATLSIKGKKQDGIFTPHQGIWFAPKLRQYYVGKRLSYNEKQEKGFSMWRLICHLGDFKPQDYFPLLSVDFVRCKEYTVLPYPFTLIKMYKDLVLKAESE